MTYEAVVFDNDGVLTHPTPLDVLKEATVEGFREVGVHDPAAEHVDQMTMHVTPEDLHAVSETYDVDPDELWRQRDRWFSKKQVADMRDGRKPLYEDYEAVRGLDVPRGIVSTNQHRTIEEILDFHGIRGDFRAYYGREMEPASLHKKKPEPHYLERALADLDADPERTLFVGDSESDVLAAENAGTDSAFLWRDHRDGYDLSASPDHELDTLHDLHDVA